MHERLLAIGFLDYSFKTMLRQLIFPYCIYIVYPRFCFLVAIQPGLAAKRDKRWVCIPPPLPACGHLPPQAGEGISLCKILDLARAKRDKRWARAKRDKRWVCIPPLPACGHLPPQAALLSGKMIHKISF